MLLDPPKSRRVVVLEYLEDPHPAVQSDAMTRLMVDFRVPRGGVGRYGVELIQALSSLEGGPEVHIFDRGNSTWQRLLRAPFSPWGRAAAASRARRIHADLVHGLHFEIPRVNIPTVVTIQDLIPLQHPPSMPSGARRRAFTSIVRSSVERAHVILTPSTIVAHALQEMFGRRPHVIPLGISAEFTPAIDRERQLARSRFAGGREYVATIYHQKAHKNLRALEETARQVDASGALVVCAGRAPASSRLVSCGYLDERELRLFYAGAEVFALPSLLEGFGLPVLESLACGTPVICGPHIGALEFLPEGAIVIDVGDEHELARTTMQLLDDRRAREEKGRKGRAWAAKLTLERTASETLAVYREVLQ